MNSVIYKFDLVDGLEAALVITRHGQQDPWIGDRVVAKAEIRLPANSEGYLDVRFRFLDRVKLAGYRLAESWGYLCASGTEVTHNYKYIYTTFPGTKWAEAFRAATEWGEKELSALVQALRNREQALRDAEVE